MSWPSIQKKNAAKALVLMMRKRQVLPGTNGSVAFSLKPTADVTREGLLPAMGGRYVELCTKYMSPESWTSDKWTSTNTDRVAFTWYRFGAAGVSDADELFHENIMFLVVPVTQNDSIFVVVGMYFLSRVNDQRTAKSIDVLSLQIIV
jgi:hypothetical protein